jgi:RNA polymerase sigma-70 factor (ECF subfamily)
MNQDASLQTSLSLLARVEADDQDAWRIFTRLYGPIVYSWCRNAGLQPGDVEDVGQEVFRVISLKLGQFDPSRKKSGAFRSWLWGITRLRILDHLRATQRQPIARGGTDNDVVFHQLEADEEPETVDGVTSEQLLVQNAIRLLQEEFDPRTWQAFWDMTTKGRPARDIGNELGMTPKAVRQAKFRVTKKLRTMLEDDPTAISQFVGARQL